MSSPGLHPAWQLPLQWPQAAAELEHRHALRTERLLKAAIVFAMLALTVLDRFGLRLTADYSIPPGMMALYGLLGAMLLAGAATLNARGALAYVALACVAGLSFLVNAWFEPRAHVSVTSFLLLIVLYAPFAVSLRPGAVAPELWRWTARLYIAFAVFLALAGIAQFFAQFVFRPEWLFNYGPLIPAPIRGSGGWNTINPAGEWIKSNGFFLREASIFSIAMAFALLCELSLARRKGVMAILAMGLVLTYSGSGLLTLAVGIMFPLGARTVLRLSGVAVAAAAVYFVLGEALNLAFTLERVGEIGAERSSAYCRFVFPGVLVLQHIDWNLWTSLLGHGSGTMPTMDATCADGVETTYAKALFEYGMLGALAFGVLVVGALNRSAAPVRLRVALGVMWLLLGGNLLTSEFLLLIYLFCAMWPEGTAARSIARAAPEGLGR
jgi:hypothetical protein